MSVTPVGVYPFSTQDGQAIPLDIIKPTGLIVLAFAAPAGAVATVAIPAGSVVGVLTANADCFVRFGATAIPATLVNGTNYPDTVFVPANAIIAVTMPTGNLTVIGKLAAGSLTIQMVQQWAGLGLPNQYGRK